MQVKPERITRAHRTCRKDARASHDGNPRSTLDGDKKMDDRSRLKSLLKTMDIPELRLDLSRPSNVRWLLRNIGVRNVKDNCLTEAVQLLVSLARDNTRRG
jgi:hypothetical protein